MKNVFQNFQLSWSAFVGHLPELIGGIVCFIITLFIANTLSKVTVRYARKRSKDGLIATFVGRVVWALIFIFGTVLTLGILGLGTVSNKILAGAGITTFVVGFALKDIGENFLAGIILAFSRPYRVGNLIECSDVKGVVRDMTMRQTTVESVNGKMIMIPNSLILNNPLTKYTNDDNNLRQEFAISVESAKAKEAIALITRTIGDINGEAKGTRPVKIVVDTLQGDKVKLLVIFWYMAGFEGSRSDTRSEIMLAVFDALAKAEIKFSG
jgi:small conductance mechanosensitive channel